MRGAARGADFGGLGFAFDILAAAADEEEPRDATPRTRFTARFTARRVPSAVRVGGCFLRIFRACNASTCLFDALPADFFMPFVTPAVRHRPPRARPTRLGGTTWSDEFDGTSVNLSKWSFEVGDGSEHGIPGWGNNELQSYNPASASVADGVLRIVASKTPRSAHVNLAKRADCAHVCASATPREQTR